MPITIDRNPEAGLTLFTLSGRVAFTEFIELMKSYGNAGPTRNEIYDARALTGERFSRSDIEALAAYLKKFPDIREPGSKTVVVVNEDIDYGITRMIDILTESYVPFEVNVFRSWDEAVKWLKQ